VLGGFEVLREREGEAELLPGVPDLESLVAVELVRRLLRPQVRADFSRSLGAGPELEDVAGSWLKGRGVLIELEAR